MVLEVETRFFDQHRTEWIKQSHEGEWAVVHGDHVLGFYSSLGDGYAAGVETYGDAEFLVKEVTPEDPVETIHRVYWDMSGQQKREKATR